MAVTITKKPPVVALCDNVMLFEFATDLENVDDVYLLVMPQYTSPSQELGIDKIYPGVPGTAQTDLSEYLRLGLQKKQQFVFPEQGNVPWLEKTDLIRTYKIRVKECWTASDGFHEVDTFPLESRRVIRGKIPRWIKQKFYSQYSSFFAWINNSYAPFLTLSPSTLYTTVTQIQKLGFLVTWVPAQGDKLKLKITATFTDGTTAVYVPSQESAAISAYSLIEFSVTCSVLGLEAWALTLSKVIYSYTVEVLSGETVKSAPKTYIIDRSQHLADHEFIFANSVGFYDTFLATGNSENYSDFSYETVLQQRDGTTNNAERAHAFIDSEDSVICRSGYISQEYAEYLSEFFESSEVYKNMGSYLVPVAIKNARILRSKDNETLYIVEFEYQPLITHKVEIDLT